MKIHIHFNCNKKLKNESSEFEKKKIKNDYFLKVGLKIPSSRVTMGLRGVIRLKKILHFCIIKCYLPDPMTRLNTAKRCALDTFKNLLQNEEYEINTYRILWIKKSHKKTF